MFEFFIYMQLHLYFASLTLLSFTCLLKIVIIIIFKKAELNSLANKLLLLQHKVKVTAAFERWLN